MPLVGWRLQRYLLNSIEIGGEHGRLWDAGTAVAEKATRATPVPRISSRKCPLSPTASSPPSSLPVSRGAAPSSSPTLRSPRPGGLRQVLDLPRDRLSAFPGFGPAQHDALQASLKFGRRHIAGSLDRGRPLQSLSQIVHFFSRSGMKPRRRGTRPTPRARLSGRLCPAPRSSPAASPGTSGSGPSSTSKAAAAAPAKRYPHIMPTDQFITLVACLLGVGIGVAIVAMRTTVRLDANRKATDVELNRLCGALHSRGYAEFGTMRSSAGGPRERGRSRGA